MDKKLVLKTVLEGYKKGNLSQNDVYEILLGFGIMNIKGPVRMDKINSKVLNKLESVVVIKGK